MTPADYAAKLDAETEEIRQQQALVLYDVARGFHRDRAPTAERLREELGRLSWVAERRGVSPQVNR